MELDRSYRAPHLNAHRVGLLFDLVTKELHKTDWLDDLDRLDLMAARVELMEALPLAFRAVCLESPYDQLYGEWLADQQAAQ